MSEGFVFQKQFRIGTDHSTCSMTTGDLIHSHVCKAVQVGQMFTQPAVIICCCTYKIVILAKQHSHMTCCNVASTAHRYTDQFLVCAQGINEFSVEGKGKEFISKRDVWTVITIFIFYPLAKLISTIT